MEKAKNLRMIPYNPCNDVVLPKLVKPTSNVYTKTDIDKMLTAAKGTDFHLALMLLIHLGLRRGELTGLKWSHIDLDNATVTIEEAVVTVNGKMVEKAPKTKAGMRTLSVGKELVAYLKKARTQYFEEVMQGKIRGLGYVVHKANEVFLTFFHKPLLILSGCDIIWTPHKIKTMSLFSRSGHFTTVKMLASVFPFLDGGQSILCGSKSGSIFRVCGLGCTPFYKEGRHDN